MKRKFLFNAFLIIFISASVSFIFNLLVVLFNLRNGMEQTLNAYIREGKKVMFDENFYPEEKDDLRFRWMKGNIASIDVVIPYDQVAVLEFFVHSYKRNKTVMLYVDDVKIDEIKVSPTRIKYVSPFMFLKRGLHKLVFIVEENCLQPLLFEPESNDTRCLQIAVGDFKVKESNNILENLNKNGFYELEKDGNEFRWLSNHSKFTFISLKDYEYSLEFLGFSFKKNRNLTIFINNLNYSYLITPSGNYVKLISFFKKGKNQIEFVTTCDTPLSLGVSKDYRCLSIRFEKILIYPKD